MVFSFQSIPSQTDIDNQLLFLNNTLQNILATELGQYQLIKNNVVFATVPAIKVEPPVLDTQFKMATQSGIECVISRMVDINGYGSFNSGIEIYQKYSIQLRQFNPNKSTQIAVMKILACSEFAILDKPIIVPYTELVSGISYESALIKLSVGGLYHRI
jgi:hypothetical protein